MATSTLAPTEENLSRVVSISVATFPGQRPDLRLQCLGDRHTLKNVADAIFDCYLADIRGENLEDHLWRFEPRESICGMALNHELTLLSPDTMSLQYIFNGAPKVMNLPLGEGSKLKFLYDEGSPTVLYIHIDSIDPMPSGRTEADYPLKVKNLYLSA